MSDSPDKPPRPIALLAALLLFFVPLAAQEEYPTGLSLSIDAGLLIPNDKQASFYGGRDDCPNKLLRVLKSEMYGNQIWYSLVSSGELSPSAVGSYSNFEVAEWATMDYRLTYQLGVAIRYGYRHGWGWRLGFDFSQVRATGQFLLNTGTQTLGYDQYVACGIYGVEKRIIIDLALTKRFNLTKTTGMELDLGFNVNNTKVDKNAIVVGGRDYSILDVWNGQSPYAGIGSYEYINQGGIGIGGLASLMISYQLQNYSIDLGYTFYYIQTRFPGYNDNDNYAAQHLVSLRFNLYKFSFL